MDLVAGNSRFFVDGEWRVCVVKISKLQKIKLQCFEHPVILCEKCLLSENRQFRDKIRDMHKYSRIFSVDVVDRHWWQGVDL